MKNRIVKSLIAMIAGSVLLSTCGVVGVFGQPVDELRIPEPTAIEMGEASSYGYIDEGITVLPANDAAAVDEDFNHSNGYPEAFGEFDWSSVFSELDLGDTSVRTPAVQVRGPIRNQNPYGMCWTFAPATSAESYIRRHDPSASPEINLSELHLGYYTYFRTPGSQPKGCKGDLFSLPSAGEPFYERGGNDNLAVATLGMGVGFVNESTAPYSWLPSNLSSNLINGSLATSANSYVLSQAKTTTGSDINRIKDLLMENGAVAGSVYWPDYSGSYLDNDTDALYVFNRTGSNHAITVVGWYDDYPAGNFRTNPGMNGAWLIQNSWGDRQNRNGYFWLSYNDSVFSCHTVTAYEAVNASTTEDHIYQMDGCIGTGSYTSGSTPGYATTLGAANVFKAEGEELLQAVSVFTMDQDIDYTIEIYKGISASGPSGAPVATVSGTMKYAGLNRVALDSPIHLDANETFAVCFKPDISRQVRLPMEYCNLKIGDKSILGSLGFASGESYLVVERSWGNTDYWSDTYQGEGGTFGNFRIKAYTTDYSECDHQYDTGVVTKQPTCIEPGERTYTCTRCGFKTTGPVNPLGHSFKATSPVAPTCTESGREAGKICTRCDYEELGDLLPRLGHDLKLVKGTPATCTTVGKEDSKECTRCDYVEGGAPIPALPHDFRIISRLEPTCTEPGHTDGRECKVCGLMEGNRIIQPLGHSLISVARVEATCTEDGREKGKYCSRCDYTEGMAVIKALGHNLTNVDGVEATCTKDGYEAGKKCSRCDYTEGMAVIKALGHDYQTVPGTPATCTEPGVTDGRKCSRCQDEISGEVIQPKGHSWDGGRKERSLNDDFVLATIYTCGNCSETRMEASKYDRIYGNTRIETSQKVAEAKLELSGKESFDTIVLACASNFPDALGGSYLAACVDAPMLLIDPSDPWTTLNYLDGKMTDGGKVYILGGNAAVPTGVDPVLESRGLDVTRCMGNTRIDTNLDVLNTIGVAGQSELVICSASGFADSLSASSSGRPIFIVDKAFTPEQKMWIQNHIFDRYVILGGTAAVPSSVGNEIMSLTGCAEGDIVRLAGESRYQTSKAIADYFFPHARRMLLAYGDNFPDGLSGGAYANLLDCPVVLVNQWSTQDAADYASDKNRTYCVTLGGPGLISDQNVYTIYP